MTEQNARSLRVADDQVPSDVRDYNGWLTALLESTDRARTFMVVADHPGTLDEVAKSSGLPHDVAADHLSTLERLGIVHTGVDQAQTVYRINAEGIRSAADALATKPSDLRTLGYGRAPLFVLPSADGGEVALSDYLQTGPVAVWFSGGLACPICRRHRARLSLSYPSIRAMKAELLEITPTPADHASMYFSHYPVSFPYLCDPKRRVWEQYGLRPGRLGSLHLLGVLLLDAIGPKTVVHDWLSGPHFQGTPEEYRNIGNEYGFFLIDRTGEIRQADAGPYMGLPANVEIERRLREIMI
jgi:peroxiredoxin